MKPDQAHLTNILIESISLLCQKGLNGYNEMSVRGVIAVTVDHFDTFVVHVNKTFDPTTVLNTSLPLVKTENEQQSRNTSVKQEIQSPGSNPGSFFSNNITPRGIQRPIRPSQQQFNRPFNPYPPMSPQNALVPVRAARPRMRMQSPNQMQQSMVPMRMRGSGMRGGGDGGMMMMRAPRGRASTPMRGGRGGGGGGVVAVRGRGKSPGLQGHVTQPKNDNSFKLVSRYMCGISQCNAAFVSLSNLRRHQKSKHVGYQGEGLVGDDEEDDEDGYYEGGDDGSGDQYMS